MALLSNASNLYGPLSPEIKARILRFLDQPTEQNWNDVYSVIVSGWGTVWQAVIAEDPTFRLVGPVSSGKKRGRWLRVPDALLVARAIKHATEGHCKPGKSRFEKHGAGACDCPEEK